MTYLEAAIAVLKGARRPMTTREVTEAALRRGLIRTRGKTPAASMSSVLYAYERRDRAALIRREYRPGPTRAARDSVRWRYAG
jgi:HB1, ASXL, restriction endonuclease HTH domain